MSNTHSIDATQSYGTYEKSGYLNENYRLFYIKDQTQKEYAYHYHDFHKVIIFLSGMVTYHIEGKAYLLQPGDILLVNRHAIHKPEIDISVPYERFIIWIRDDISTADLKCCFEKAVDCNYNLVRLTDQVQKNLSEILRKLQRCNEDTEFGAELLKDAIFTQFMIYLNRLFLNKEYIHDHKAYESDSQIDRLLTYINQNLSEELSIEYLSRKFYISRYYMMRKFKAETGYTIHNYVTNKRLLLARKLITENMPVMKAAAQSGFRDYTAFERAYKKHFGHSPSSDQPRKA